MNLPNKLSVFRIILMPVMIGIAYLVPQEQMFGPLNIKLMHFVLCIIFVIGSLTDFLDGYLARKDNLITDFGKFIDPLADKVLVLTAMVLMVEFNILPAWIPIIVLTREFAVSGYRLVAASQSGKVIAASIWGKIKTSTQMVAIIMLLLDQNPFFAFWNMNFSENKGLYIYNLVGSLLMIVSVIATIQSGMDYLKDIKELLKDA